MLSTFLMLSLFAIFMVRPRMDELGNSVHLAKTIGYEFYWNTVNLIGNIVGSYSLIDLGKCICTGTENSLSKPS